MNDRTLLTIERALAWCGPIFILAFIVFFGIMAGNAPPPNMMGMTGEELVNDYYLANPGIGPGMMMCAVFGVFYLLWSCQLASLLRNPDGSMSIFSMLELVGGALTGWLLASCSAIWVGCAVLAGQVDPDIIKAFHTINWIVFDCTWMITASQMLGLGLYTVLNKRQTIFPAWAGWTSIAIGAAFATEVFMPFVDSGPFAVGGVWNYFILFGGWLVAFFGVYNYYVLRHLYRTPAQREAAGEWRGATTG